MKIERLGVWRGLFCRVKKWNGVWVLEWLGSREGEDKDLME